MTSTVIKVSHDELREEFRACLQAGLVPYVRSSPGIGKSDLAKSFAAEYDLEVIDLRLSQCTPEDLQGFPMRDGDKAVFTPFSLFPLEGDELPLKFDENNNPVMIEIKDENGNIKKEQARRQGWLLLLDELSSANKAVQAAAYKLILDRQVGSFNIHKRCAMIACGNLMSDKAVVHQMSTALQSRLIHYQLEVNVADWIKWATKKGVDFRIQAFIQYRASMLHNFDPDSHTDITYACPRTWEFLDRLIRGKPIDRVRTLPRIVGTIGHGAGHEFMTFCDVMHNIPAWKDVIDPKTNMHLAVPADASAKFATICWIANEITEKDLKNVLGYIKQFGADFQVIFCRGVLARFPNADQKVPEFGKYAMSTITSTP